MSIHLYIQCDKCLDRFQLSTGYLGELSTHEAFKAGWMHYFVGLGPIMGEPFPDDFYQDLCPKCRKELGQ